MDGDDRRSTAWRRAAAAMAASVVAVAAISGCSVGWPGSHDADGGVDGTQERARRGRGATDATGTEVREISGTSGRFRVRIERGVEGVVDLDAIVVGTFDGRGGSEVVIDLRALATPVVADPDVDWPADTPDHLVVRQVGNQVFLHTGLEPLPWLMLPIGIDPSGVRDTVSAHDPSRLVETVERSAVEVTVTDGGLVDGAGTERRSGWIAGSALGDLDDGSGRLRALAGIAPTELMDRLLRFDLWVGVDDGIPRRLVLEWDLGTLAELARRLDGTDEGMGRLRYRTSVEWFDLGTPVHIEIPPRHLIGVIDPASGTR